MSPRLPSKSRRKGSRSTRGETSEVRKSRRRCLPRDGRRHYCGPRSGFAFGIFPAEPVVGGFVGVGGVELSDIRGSRVGREVVQFAGARGGGLVPIFTQTWQPRTPAGFAFDVGVVESAKLIVCSKRLACSIRPTGAVVGAPTDVLVPSETVMPMACCDSSVTLGFA